MLELKNCVFSLNWFAFYTLIDNDRRMMLFTDNSWIVLTKTATLIARFSKWSNVAVWMEKYRLLRFILSWAIDDAESSSLRISSRFSVCKWRRTRQQSIVDKINQSQYYFLECDGKSLKIRCDCKHSLRHVVVYSIVKFFVFDKDSDNYSLEFRVKM